MGKGYAPTCEPSETSENSETREPSNIRKHGANIVLVAMIVFL